MRGKAIDIGPIHGELGITPAYAGKSCRPEAAVPDLRDHPRVCGEKKFACRRSRFFPGSPPRMRGKDAKILETAKTLGITPAYAGKSFRIDAHEIAKGDHPRVCGEKSSFFSGVSLGGGSPPRMRGKVSEPHGSERFHRITPAYAGKSMLLDSQRFHHRGSPPRMRGKVFVTRSFVSNCGITPAYAGKRQGR